MATSSSHSINNFKTTVEFQSSCAVLFSSKIIQSFFWKGREIVFCNSIVVFKLLTCPKATSPFCRSSRQTVSNGLLQCDWLTACTGNDKKTFLWTNIDALKNFKSLFLVECFGLSSDLWGVYFRLVFGQFVWNFAIMLETYWNPKESSRHFYHFLISWDLASKLKTFLTSATLKLKKWGIKIQIPDNLFWFNVCRSQCMSMF